MKKALGTVRLWPAQASAETEVIERLRTAAEKIDYRLVEVDKNGYLLSDPTRRMSHQDVDFAINLHFDSPKNYDCYSYGALWNPRYFYSAFGIERVLANQLSHDDFLTCGSESANSIVRNARFDLESEFQPLNHTLSEPILKPRERSERRLFYCGINWERGNNKPGRHHQILQILDKKDAVNIYGPENISGFSPWADFRNYRGELPFDGRSLISAAADAGAVLVFSSEHHKLDDIMSNRMFEGLAAGALIIGDEHPELAKILGKNYICIKTSAPASQQAIEIQEALNWANANPGPAYQMCVEAQKALTERTLDLQLSRLIEYHNSRQPDKKLDLTVVLIASEGSAFQSTIDRLNELKIPVAVVAPEEISRQIGQLSVLNTDKLTIQNSIDRFGRLASDALSQIDTEFVCFTYGADNFLTNFGLVSPALESSECEVIQFGRLTEEFVSDQTISSYIAPAKSNGIDSLSSFFFRVSKLKTLAPLLRDFDCEIWLRSAAINPVAVFPPILISYPRRMTRIAASQGGAPSHSMNYEFSKFYSGYNKNFARPAAAVLPTISLKQFGLDDVQALSDEDRRRLAITIFKGLPLPRSIFYVLRMLHKTYQLIRRPGRYLSRSKL